MTGREVEAVIVDYLTARGWRRREGDGDYWYDPMGSERGPIVRHWSAALKLEARRQEADAAALRIGGPS